MLGADDGANLAGAPGGGARDARAGEPRTRGEDADGGHLGSESDGYARVKKRGVGVRAHDASIAAWGKSAKVGGGRLDDR
jgi:hypothetical protein